MIFDLDKIHGVSNYKGTHVNRGSLYQRLYKKTYFILTFNDSHDVGMILYILYI